MSDGAGIAILVGGFIVVIIIIVLINKLLDYLSDRFPIGYNLVMIALAGLSFGLSFLYWNLKAGGDEPTGVLVMQILGYYFYMTLFLTDIEATDYDTEEWGHDTFTDRWKLYTENHYTPGFVRKIGFSLLGTGIFTLTTIFANFSWIALILQLIVPVAVIFNNLRDR